ncbi:MAG: phosphoribosylanthranilate isomerase, partial [Planctomycetaceae bacterium]
MWIKICGIRDELALQGAVASGADAVGFNFVAGSPRCVTVEQARQLVARLPPTVLPVGLFCNQPVEFVLETARACRLRLVQLHGDESVAEAAQVAREFPMLRSFNWSDAGLAPLAHQLAGLAAAGAEPWGILGDG